MPLAQMQQSFQEIKAEPARPRGQLTNVHGLLAGRPHIVASSRAVRASPHATSDHTVRGDSPLIVRC